MNKKKVNHRRKTESKIDSAIQVSEKRFFHIERNIQLLLG